MDDLIDAHVSLMKLIASGFNYGSGGDLEYPIRDYRGMGWSLNWLQSEAPTTDLIRHENLRFLPGCIVTWTDPALIDLDVDGEMIAWVSGNRHLHSCLCLNANVSLVMIALDYRSDGANAFGIFTAALRK